MEPAADEEFDDAACMHEGARASSAERIAAPISVTLDVSIEQRFDVAANRG